MRLTFLRISDFRNLKKHAIALSPDFNLVVGGNDSGKTNILDATALALSAPLRPLGIAAQIPQWHGPEPGQAEPRPAIHAAVEWDGTECEWTERRAAAIEPDDVNADSGLPELTQRFRTALQSQEPLPVFAYYGSQNIGDNTPLPEVEVDPRLRGLAGAFTPIRNGKAVLETMRKLAAAAEGTRRFTIRQAIERALSDCVFVDPVRLLSIGGIFCVSLDGGPPQPVERQGSGVLRLMTIAADLAHRCCLANPRLGVDAPRQTNGVVLIDDIETHLHPKWQRSIVHDLRTAFPSIQFLAASHSPFIIQSVHAGRIFDLDGHETADAPDLSIEDIAESIMGIRVPQRSKRYLAMNAAAREARRLISAANGASEEKKAEIRDKLNLLSMPFSTNQAFHGFLAIERLEAGLLEDEE